MKYFFDAWEKVKGQIGSKLLLLFFDFDGTLAPIASTPEEAHIARETLDLLSALSQKKTCKVAIISGRALPDIEQKIGLEGLVYAGNHGLEIAGPGIKHAVTISDNYLETLKTVKSDLRARIEGYKGAFIEDKGPTLSVHFRLVKLERIVELRSRIRAALLPYNIKNLIKVRTGKMVFEIRPPVRWDKGNAVLWLIDRWRTMLKNDPAVALYCGDDATDEDAFRILEGRGITVVVGAHEDSAAQYCLNSQAEVNGLLANICELKKNKL